MEDHGLQEDKKASSCCDKMLTAGVIGSIASVRLVLRGGLSLVVLKQLDSTTVFFHRVGIFAGLTDAAL